MCTRLGIEPVTHGARADALSSEPHGAALTFLLHTCVPTLLGLPHPGGCPRGEPALGDRSRKAGGWAENGLVGLGLGSEVPFRWPLSTKRMALTQQVLGQGVRRQRQAMWESRDGRCEMVFHLRLSTNPGSSVLLTQKQTRGQRGAATGQGRRAEQWGWL